MIAFVLTVSESKNTNVRDFLGDITTVVNTTLFSFYIFVLQTRNSLTAEQSHKSFFQCRYIEKDTLQAVQLLLDNFDLFFYTFLNFLYFFFCLLPLLV